MRAIGRRRLLLGIAFVATVASAALAPGDEAAPKKGQSKIAPPAPVSVTDAKRTPAPGKEATQVMPYTRSAEAGVAVVDIFEARQPPSAAPAAAQKPQAPKLPFTYMGFMGAGEQRKVMLVQGEQLYLVREGEQFATSYRLDEVKGDALVLTYLPLDERQSLPIGDHK